MMRMRVVRVILRTFFDGIIFLGPGQSGCLWCSHRLLIPTTVQCTPKQDADDDELQVLYEINGRFLQQKSHFDRDAILCFRRGQWNFPKTGKWQARLCISKQPYVEQARIAVKVVQLVYPKKITLSFFVIHKKNTEVHCIQR